MILTETATATTIDRPTSPTLTCAVCPFARLIEDNRYCCQVSQTASDVKRGHWEATVSCFEALAKAEAEKVAEPAAEVEAPIAQTATPAAPAAIGTDDEPPNRGDNGRGRVQPAAKKSQDRNSVQLAIIREELAAIGIKLGKLISSRSDVKGWRLDWHGDKAGLYWTIGNGWEVASLKYDTELTGQWEGFDLEQHLECNGIDLEELPADLRVAS